MCGPERASMLMMARNVRAVSARKGGGVRRLVIEPVEAEDDRRGGNGSSRTLTYEELVGGHELVVLKRYNGLRFVMWSERDKFARGRFNPDTVHGPVVRRGPIRLDVSRLDPTALAVVT